MGGFRVRAAREEDIEQLVEMGLTAYPDSGGFEQRRRNLVQNSFGSLTDVRVIEKDGRLAGQASLYSIEIWLGGRLVPCAGIASVAVTPGERREGVSHALLEQVHAEVNARQAALTLLYPFREGFYARLGYATTAPLVTLRVATDAIAHAPSLVDAAAAFTFRTLEGPLLTEARTLYDQVAATLAGRIARTEARWLKLISLESRHWMGAMSAEGRLEGYVAFSYDVPMSHGRQTLVVHELTARNGRAERALLVALGKQRDQVDDVEINVPLGSPLAFAFYDAPGSRRGTAAIEHPLGTIGAGPMVRLADAARALTLRGYSADGALTLEIAETPASDPGKSLTRDAPKRLHLVVRNGQGEIAEEGAGAGGAKSEQEGATLALALSTLGSIVAAGQRPSDAASLGLVQADANAIATADALFAGPRFQCLDPF
jgi:predicted acetyltransferase